MTNRARLGLTFAPAMIAAITLLAGCKNPANPAAYLIDGDNAFEATQWSKATESYEQYLALREGNFRVRQRIGESYLYSGKYAEAAHHLRLVYVQRPGDDKVVDLLAEALYRGDKHDELYRLLRSEAIDSQDLADWMRLGDYAMKLGDKDTAQTAYLSAAKVSGATSTKPYIALFDYYRGLGQKSLAINAIRNAAWVDSTDTKVAERIKLAGLIDGPTLPLMPAEARIGGSANVDAPAVNKPLPKGAAKDRTVNPDLPPR